MSCKDIIFFCVAMFTEILESNEEQVMFGAFVCVGGRGWGGGWTHFGINLGNYYQTMTYLLYLSGRR